jgi:hypothetical protein
MGSQTHGRQPCPPGTRLTDRSNGPGRYTATDPGRYTAAGPGRYTAAGPGRYMAAGSGWYTAGGTGRYTATGPSVSSARHTAAVQPEEWDALDAAATWQSAGK